MEAEIAFRMLGLFFWKLVHNALLVKEKLLKDKLYLLHVYFVVSVRF